MTTVTEAVEALVRKTIDLGDQQMGTPWRWKNYDEEGLRFALLMTHHELRDLAVRLGAALTGRRQAQAILAQYHEAYRDLTGVLAAVREVDLDRAPSEGEWPIRQVVAHMLDAEYGFLAVSQLGLERRRSGKSDEPADAEIDAFRAPYAVDRANATEALLTATREQLRDAFFNVHMRVLGELGDVGDTDLDAPVWFWDGSMPLRFRLHRFEEHLRQHTIQLDKTLAGIGRPPTEAQRLVRNIYNALADVESETAPLAGAREETARVITERAAALPV